MPDDLGDLEDAIVRELTRDGHGQLDTVAAAPILADLLEMELGHRGHGSHEVIPEDMSLSDALDYAFDVSLLMGFTGTHASSSHTLPCTRSNRTTRWPWCHLRW